MTITMIISITMMITIHQGPLLEGSEDVHELRPEPVLPQPQVWPTDQVGWRGCEDDLSVGMWRRYIRGDVKTMYLRGCEDDVSEGMWSQYIRGDVKTIYPRGCEDDISEGMWSQYIREDVKTIYPRGCEDGLFEGMWRWCIRGDVKTIYPRGCEDDISEGMWRRCIRSEDQQIWILMWKSLLKHQQDTALFGWSGLINTSRRYEKMLRLSKGRNI